MEELVVYLLKVNIAFTVLYLCYKLLCNKDTFLQMRRFTLLFFYFVAWIYPLISLPSFNVPFGNNLNLYSVVLSEIVVSPDSEVATATTFPLPATTILVVLYIIGIALLLFRTLIELYKISSKLRHALTDRVGGILFFITDDDSEEAYSFFHWICVSSAVYRSNGLKEILLHEQTHSRELHSVDVLIAQLSIIFCWFNPFVWLMRSEVRMNHEYLADKRVISAGCNKKEYQYRLIGLVQTPHKAAAKLYNSFSVLPLKNRIKMLNRKSTSNIMRSKYLMFIPVFGLLLFLSNCQDAPKEAEPQANDMQTELEANIPEVTATGNYAQPQSDEPIFEVVEKMPVFPGGQEALMSFLSSNIKYPLSAQEKSIQGRVVAQFIVEKDGSVSNVQVVRSVDPDVDAEAVRVIKSFPRWEPGQQRGQAVRCKYTVPIMFRLQ